MIRVRVNAASVLARAGLEALLRASPEIEIVNSPDAAPEVIIADANQDLRDTPPDAAVLLLSSEPHRVLQSGALPRGLRGVISPDMSAPQILAAIQSAAAGLAVLDPRELEAVLALRRIPEPAESLSARETEVLGMMAEGLSNKEIAYRLGLSEHTVKFHVTSIMSKLNAGSRTEAVTLGIRQGLILI